MHHQRSEAGDKEIASTRVDAEPRELVWSVWTESAHIERLGRLEEYIAGNVAA